MGQCEDISTRAGIQKQMMRALKVSAVSRARLVDLIAGMTAPNPMDRMTLTHALAHEAFLC